MSNVPFFDGAADLGRPTERRPSHPFARPLLEECLSMLRALQWAVPQPDDYMTGDHYPNQCPHCQGEPPTHLGGCELWALIQKVEKAID